MKEDNAKKTHKFHHLLRKWSKLSLHSMAGLSEWFNKAARGTKIQGLRKINHFTKLSTNKVDCQGRMVWRTGGRLTYG